MRIAFLPAMIALAVLGCASDKADTPSEQPQGGSAVNQHVSASQVGGEEAGAETGDAAGENAVDPAIREYVYPGAHLDGSFSMPNSVSIAYKSGAGFAEVVEFYRTKPLKPVEITDSHAYFASNIPEGAFTVTVSPGSDFTQIILKLDRKP